ncbi:MAG: sigma-54-dependent Fis family transcriptional regulator [Myxococcales bacterium]|nr:sigma-54-dependent Fis family transcriptional regulator [Myxococcales bacterium]
MANPTSSMPTTQLPGNSAQLVSPSALSALLGGTGSLPSGGTALTLRRTRLVRTDADGNTAEYIFDQPIVKLGAMDDNDVVLDDDQASRYHARIYQEGDDFLIEDLKSTNGTWVNRVRVRDAWLRSGAMIRVGNTQLRFSVQAERVDIAPSQHESLGGIVGRTEAIRRLMGVVDRIAPTGATVVLEGETGTGKEVVARTIHQLSKRAAGPFIVFDCGAVQQNLIESELFGHEKGSFTGALASRQGLFEMANGGTIFLDEIGELALDLQPKLLRALEQREVRRVGGNRPIKIDVRVIAATNRDLAEEVKADRFREDLFYRLGVVRLKLPALRERQDDIGLLGQHMLRTGSFNRVGDGQKVKGISYEAREALRAYQWPGNVRELLNVIERACSFCEGDLIGVDDLPDHISGAKVVRMRRSNTHPTEQVRQGGSSLGNTVPLLTDISFKSAKEQWLGAFEKEYLAKLLSRHSGNLSQAAREADVDRKHFRRLARKYGLIGGGVEEEDEE